MGTTVTVVVNNQQAQMLDRLVKEGLAETHGEVIAEGFRRFCAKHPEIVRGDEDGEEAS